ncbi:hypothetical protein [Fibrobacter sp. UBA4297]|nr:hypothetical protein [Fibrobacter sp. UBA4297]
MSRFYPTILFAMILFFVKPTFAYYSEYNEVDEQKESKLLYHSVTDSVPPSLNYYANLFVFSDALTVFFGLVVLDFDIEKENSYRGSMMFNFSSIFRFYDFQDEWEGFKSIWSVGVGYRQYLETNLFRDVVFFSKVHVKHRNVPYNSMSIFVQVMASPSLLYDNYRGIEVDLGKHRSFGWGGNAIGKLGVVWNLGNFLWEIGFFGGYQYWNGVTSSVYDNDGIAFVDVTPSKGRCFGFETKFGF